MSVTEEANTIYIGLETIVVDINSQAKLNQSGKWITQQVIIVRGLSKTHEGGWTYGWV